MLTADRRGCITDWSSEITTARAGVEVYSITALTIDTRIRPTLVNLYGTIQAREAVLTDT